MRVTSTSQNRPALLRTLLRARYAVYVIFAFAEAAWGFATDSPRSLTIAAIALVAGIIPLPAHQIDRKGELALFGDLGLVTGLWYLYGRTAPIDFFLFFVVAIATLLLPVRMSHRVIAGSFAVIGIMALAHIETVASVLPLFHAPHPNLVVARSEFAVVLAVVVIAAAVFSTLAHRRRDERERILASEERYRALVEMSPDAIVVIQRGRVVFSNPAASRLIGAVDDGRSIDLPVERFLDPRYAKVAAERSIHAAEGTKNIPMEMTLIGLDGNPIDVVTVSGPTMFDGQKAAQVIIRDVRQEKTIRHKLAQTEAFFATAFQNSATGMAVLDMDGCIARTNPALSAWLGYDPEELLAMTWNDIVLFDDLHRVHIPPKAGQTQWNERARFVTKNGNVMWANVRLALLPESDGRDGRYFAQLEDVTEEVRVRQALEESEERYRTLFERIPVALYRSTPDGKLLAGNAALARLLGYESSDAMRGLYVPDSFARPEQREHMSALAQANGMVDAYEVELIRPDGSRVWARDTMRVIQSGDDIVFEGALVDVTERKRVEDALRESEERFRTSFEEAPLGIVLVDLDRRLFKANREMCTILGYTEEELLRLTLNDVLHPDDRPDTPEKLALLSGEIRSYQKEVRYLRRDGAVIWADLNVSLVRDAGGNPAYTIGQVQDITARKHAEEVRRRLISIIDATTDLIVLFSADGDVTWANAAARSWYGIRDDEELPRITVQSLIEPTEGSEDPATIFEHLRRHGIWEGVLTLRGKYGITAPGSAVVLAHTDESGRITRISAIVRDISDRVETQRRLERLVRSKDEFVASVSHELRTPLTAVVGLAEELKTSWESFSAEETDEFIRLIAEQSAEVANLVEDLLVAARSEIGKVTVVPAKVALTAQLDTVLGALAGGVQDRISIRVEPVDVWADATRLRQILRNLLTNAIRYGGQNIEVTATTLDGIVQIHVTDDGPGVSPEYAEVIFEPYGRAHEAGSQPNSVGLGLTVSRHLARLMGGDLTYWHDGQSTFSLTLPCYARTTADTVSASTSS